MVSKHADQEEFDKTYITSREIATKLNIDRSTIKHAKERGLLPPPIVICGLKNYLWKRSTIEANLDAWELVLASRRGELQ